MSTESAQQVHACEMCLSHVIRYRHVLTAVTVIIRIIYKITWCPNKC